MTAYGAYTFTWTEVNGTCTDADDVTVNFYEQSVANAGNGGDECDLTFSLNAVPSVGTGTWTYAGPGTATFAPDANDPAATATVTAYGAYTFTWTEVNGTCTDADDVTVNFYEQPVANAGNGGDECDLTFSLNAVPSVGTGTWTYAGPGTATFAPDANDPAATATVTAYGAYTFTWTEVNGTCTDADDVTVNFYEQPVVSDETDQTQCDNGTFTMTQSTPSVGTGVWTLESGTATITDDSDPTTTVIVTGTSATVRWTVTNGTCSAFDDVILNVPPCAINFTGRIIWEGDRLTTMTGVNNATTTLSVDDTDTDITNTNGDYALLAANGGSDFDITPVKNLPLPNALNGLTTADASRITQHALNIFLLTDPYKLIAADVNYTNTITTADASFITQAILGNPVNQLAFINKTWRFVPKDYVFPVPASPWSAPEKISLVGISGDQTDQDFIGIKMGDVNNTANPANFGGQLAPNLIWRVQDRLLQQGETFVAEFRADNLYDLLAYQFGMRFDPIQLELLEIETISGSPMNESNFGTYNLAEGEIRAALALGMPITLEDGTAVFRLRFKALAEGIKLSNVLHLTNDVLLGEAYKGDYTPGPVSLVYGAVVTSTGEPHTGKLVLQQNRPNPFHGRTVIGFELPDACDAMLRVFDTNGRLVREHSASYPAGNHQVEFDFGTERGVLYYELTTPFGVLAKKMVLTRE
ncbi:MAG: hypothetical protein KIS77_00385 [Saprospiraceae bacterium]|nr:hypothetical protein [Saprospiraceae bacterium]